MRTNGTSAKSATVGCDGVVGFIKLTGGGTTPSRAGVQCRGECLKSHFIGEEIGRAGPILNLLLRYTHALSSTGRIPDLRAAAQSQRILRLSRTAEKACSLG